MNSYYQAKESLVKLGWTEYLEDFKNIINNKKIKGGRCFQNDTELHEYVSVNLPLCIGERVTIKKILNRNNSPVGDDLETLRYIINQLEILDIKHPYGLINGIDALHY